MTTPGFDAAHHRVANDASEHYVEGHGGRDQGVFPEAVCALYALRIWVLRRKKGDKPKKRLAANTSCAWKKVEILVPSSRGRGTTSLRAPTRSALGKHWNFESSGGGGGRARRTPGPGSVLRAEDTGDLGSYEGMGGAGAWPQNRPVG